MVKLVIFDHDGLMVNSEEVVYQAIAELFAKYNHDLKWEYFCRHIGTPVADALKHFYADYPLPIPFDDFFLKRDQIVSTYIANKLEMMPGLPVVLKSLKSRGIRMAIATSGKRDYITKNLEKFGIANYFETIVCVDDVKRGKPFPDLILETLNRTKVDKKDAIMLEDAPSGVEASYNAGVFSIAIPTKGVDYNKFKKANMILPNLETFNQLLHFF